MLPHVAEFTRAEAAGVTYYERIRVTEGRREQYIVYWNTAQGSLSVDKTYRVIVLSGSTKLGYVDIDLVATSAEASGVDTNQFTPVVLGNWLPIRFRIEKGALCGETIDCFEGTLTPDGGDFVVPSGFAGVAIPQGAVDHPVNIIIERVPIDEANGGLCLPTPMQQVLAMVSDRPTCARIGAPSKGAQIRRRSQVMAPAQLSILWRPSDVASPQRPLHAEEWSLPESVSEAAACGSEPRPECLGATWSPARRIPDRSSRCSASRAPPSITGSRAA